MAVPFKNRLQRYNKESLDTLFRTLQFKRGVERYSSGSSGSTPLTTSVTVTAAEFIAASTLGDTVKTLLPSPGAGKFLLIESIVIKFKDATVAFDGGPTYVLTALTNTFNFNINFPGTTSGVTGYVGVAVNQVNQSLDLVFTKGTAPTIGDGNCIFEISYSIQDF